MTQVTVSDEQRAQLLAAGSGVVLVDSVGEVVGRAVRYVRVDGRPAAADWPSDAEIDRDLSEGRFKTAEQAAAWLSDLKAGLS